MVGDQELEKWRKRMTRDVLFDEGTGWERLVNVHIITKERKIYKSGDKR